MNEPALSPGVVLAQVAAALPEDCRDNVIIVGSLAAGYYFFRDDGEAQVRTKDVDCLISPHLTAVQKGVTVADRLFDAGWTIRREGTFTEPGTAETPEADLPVVRLRPPAEDGWFVELLGAPVPGAGEGRAFSRLETRHGHFGLCSFGYLALAEERPVETPYGVHIAHPAMMALANLLHHPGIGGERMSGFIGTREIKRSNKDLGRVLALAYLTEAGGEEVSDWTDRWAEALQNRFPDRWRGLAARAGSGVEALLGSPSDLDEALHTVNTSLLARRPLSVEALRVTGLRLLDDALRPLAERAEADA